MDERSLPGQPTQSARQTAPEERGEHCPADLSGIGARAFPKHHSRNIIHRDIKPSNVPISGSCVKVADFGLAKRLDAPPGDRLTIDKAVLGTPGFMAPEQTHGNPNVDERADIYSLGAILYRM